MSKQREIQLEIIQQELRQSDIVWGRYGMDTVADLSERILKKLEEKKEESF